MIGEGAGGSHHGEAQTCTQERKFHIDFISGGGGYSSCKLRFENRNDRVFHWGGVLGKLSLELRKAS